MISLTDQQKQLIFGYCMGVISDEEVIRAEQLIAENVLAEQFYSKIKTTLSPLDSLEPQDCPDELAEGTLWRLNNLARSSQLRLERLLVEEQEKSPRLASRFWPNLGQLVATAAVIIFLSGAVIGPLSAARQNYWNQRCQMQLKRIWQGMNNYVSDHNGRQPAVATAAGDPWWKVGYQGDENHSNTRHIWLLAKDGYVNPTDFVCPAKRQGRALQFDTSKVKDYNDFPARRYITYSFRIKCNKATDASCSDRHALISDLNPLFEKLPKNYSDKMKLQLSSSLINSNSNNHNGRGQNILFSDGGVKFTKQRRIGVAADDIFTLRDIKVYKGYEVPSCETDAFLAP